MKKTIQTWLVSFLILLVPALAPAKDSGQNTIFKCKISELHPTQLAVGLLEVKDKKHDLNKLSGHDLKKFEEENPEPTVKGPNGRLYIIDHHHLALALYDIGENNTYCSLEADYSKLTVNEFWARMNRQKWVYPYDENGSGPLPYSALPSTVAALKDDPYRSLASAVRHAGGYNKTPEPFAEFRWADFFRRRIAKHDLSDNFDDSVKKGVHLAHSEEAVGLPGYQKQ
ncbi:MAG: hypothetical protein NTX59_08730 [Elusimicrobia bacterium]|nr:hypothetical protein [Elusimicrobiota bacterium]